MMDLSQQFIQSILNYDPRTGIFTRISDNPRWDGKEAGYIKKDIKYRCLRVGDRDYPAHRIAFLWMTGSMPDQFVDHLNGVRHDNRWCNLAQATRLDNAKNKSLYKNSTTGIAGVYWDKRPGKWRAEISKCYIGNFDTIFDAAAARISAQNRHGFSDRHGRK